MNAVEIEEAISTLAAAPFDAEEFPYAFLEAFGNKATTIKRLRAGSSNKSDVDGVLQASNIHIKTCAPGEVAETLTTLRNSAATMAARNRVKFLLATDGNEVHVEDRTTGDFLICNYLDIADNFRFFAPLAGISYTKELTNTELDRSAARRLNRLYVELLKNNPDWVSVERQHDMNHFMARLIFCFFAEDTDIFAEPDLFTSRIETMSAPDSSNTHEVISELFRAMNTKSEDRASAEIARWAQIFPYVNGGLFSGSTDVPRFSKIARSYLLHIGKLDWTKINPDIFGSMIQTVADDEERGSLGMHYTSVPNILKVLNPLFLDDLREKLDEAGDNPRKLLNLRNRMAKIRVFDPACGSGNFLVIAYKEMRAIEAEINKRRGEGDRRTDIPLTNFRGIELRDFPAEIARLALIIAEYQCDVTYRGQKEALAGFLPLDAMNWITCGNALRLDWLSICPPTGTGVKHHADDLFMSPVEQAEIDFENEGGETYICGNPPYLGSVMQSAEQKFDLRSVFEGYTNGWKSLDYVAGWFIKAVEFGTKTKSCAAFVSTNSICQGEQVPILWPILFKMGFKINFAHTSFKWSNLASNKAGVTVVIVGISNQSNRGAHLFSIDGDGFDSIRHVDNINAYLTPALDVIVQSRSESMSNLSKMVRGNMPNDGGHLLMHKDEAVSLLNESPEAERFVRMFIGAREFTRSTHRHCLWINKDDREKAESISLIKRRIEKVHQVRMVGGKQARDHAETPHRFVFAPHRDGQAIAIPAITSENREYLPVGIVNSNTIVGAKCYVIYGEPLWNVALVASRLHWVWIGTVCVRMRTDFSYSNTLGWNTFPVPKLTEKNKADLTRCAEDLLLAREAHFPATIADLYEVKNGESRMPADLRAAHDRNDETLERIYIGRRFKNDTERLEKLFELYTKFSTHSSSLEV